MSSLVYFKFKANVKTDSIPFDGSSISVKDLKTAIRTKCYLHSSDFDLKLEDSNGKAYTKDEELIPKYTSIVVRRVPKLTVDAPKKKATPAELNWRDANKNAQSGDVQAQKHVNLADSDLTEEEKIKIMMERSSEAYSEKNFAVKAKPYGVPPATYVCHKCGQPGHWIHNCPGVRDITGKIMDVKNVKRPTGIPQDFLLEVDAGTPGAYLGKSGKYMVPIKDAEAYAQGKKDKRPFSAEENPPYVPPTRTPPKQFICPLCSELFRDAVLVSCCCTTYCNDCIMGHVFDSQILGSRRCPNCDAVLTDHESCVFENVLVRSMIRDWLATEALPEPVVSTQQDMFKFDTFPKALNSRRVLKPKHGLGSNGKSTTEAMTSGNAVAPAEQSPSAAVSPCEELPNTSVSTNSLSASTTIPVSVDSKEPVISVTTSDLPSVVPSNTCAVVATAPSTNVLGSGKSLPAISSISSSQFSSNSYPASAAIVPTILPSVAGATNPLLSAFYSMPVDNLSVPVTAQQVVMPVAFQGSVVGGNEWSVGTAFPTSHAAGLVDSLLQVNQNPYGLIPGQPLSGPMSTALSAPIRDLDGHKVLSKEEFYRLKMKMLDSVRRRHRHRSRSRSPVRTDRRNVNHESDYHLWRQERDKRERRLARYSSGDRHSGSDHWRRYSPEDRYRVRRDRDRRYRFRRIDDPVILDDGTDGYRRGSRPRERFPIGDADAGPRETTSRPPSSESASPSRHKISKRVFRNREPHAICDEENSKSNRSPHACSVVPQYDVSETESTESKGLVSQKDSYDHLEPHDSRVDVTWKESKVSEPRMTEGPNEVAHKRSQKKAKKDKKHRKHKHRHRSENQDNLEQENSTEVAPPTWISAESKPEDYENVMSTVIDELNRKKKHKKHKHGAKDKKKSHKHRDSLIDSV